MERLGVKVPFTEKRLTALRALSHERDDQSGVRGIRCPDVRDLLCPPPLPAIDYPTRRLALSAVQSEPA